MTEMSRTIAIEEIQHARAVKFGTSGARGLVVDMSDDVCFAYASAFLGAIEASAGSVAVAMDLRPSSPLIASACAAAIQDAGMTVDFCGAVPTPALAYHCQTNDEPGIMVTGSHIPFDRNGIKFYRRDGEITKADEATISRAVVELPRSGSTTELPAATRSAYDAYVARYVDFFAPQCLAGMRIAFYEHSSLARDVLRTILERLGAEVVSLGRTDEFVPIDTEAVSLVDIEQARCWAQELRFDAIVSTDGDADRPLVGDENGGWFRGDVVGILSAQYLRATAVVTTVSSNTAVEACRSFAQVSRTRIGSPYVIEGIEQLLAAGLAPVVGFEPNGGFLVGSRIERDGRVLAPLMTRDAVLPILCVLMMARELGVRVSELPSRLPARFTASDRIQSFPTELSHRLIAGFAESHNAFTDVFGDLCGAPATQDQTDGLRVTLRSGEIVHLRPSGNAPELRCYAEAGSQERAEHLVRECLSRLKNSV